MSKVIHVRLSDESLYTCLQVLESSGIDTTNLPLATIVRRYIEGSTENYRKQVSLSMPEDLPIVIAQLVDDTPIPIVMPDITINESNNPEYDPDKLENIRKAIEDAEGKDHKPDVELTDVIEEERVLPPPPWEAAGILTWEVILSISPKDILIEQAEKEKDIVLQHAIQCVYTDLPTHEWGSKHACSLVERVIPTIQLYFKEDR